MEKNSTNIQSTNIESPNENEINLGALEIKNTVEPLEVNYCNLCRFPEEYCEYSHPYLIKHGHKIAETSQEKETKTEEKEGEPKKEEPKPETTKEKKKGKETHIVVELSKRGKKKHTTYVSNAEKFGLNLKDLAKLFSKKFACSSTVTKEDNGLECITLTGEFGYEIVEFICEKFPQIKPENCLVKEPK